MNITHSEPLSAVRGSATASARAERPGWRGFDAAGGARLDPRPRRRHLRRQLRPRVPDRYEGGAAAARLAAPPARGGRALPHAASAGWAGAMARCCSPRPTASTLVQADAVVLALGGASWARLGSDGAWVPLLAAQRRRRGAAGPANCGFDADWSEHFSSRHAGEPLTTVAIAGGRAAAAKRRRASSWSPPPASKAAWCTRCRPPCATRSRARQRHHLARPAAGLQRTEGAR
jgi:hypothetical protein